MLQTEGEELLGAEGEAKVEGKGAKMKRTKMNLVITRVVGVEAVAAEGVASSEDIDLVMLGEEGHDLVTRPMVPPARTSHSIMEMMMVANQEGVGVEGVDEEVSGDVEEVLGVEEADSEEGSEEVSVVVSAEDAMELKMGMVMVAMEVLVAVTEDVGKEDQEVEDSEEGKVEEEVERVEAEEDIKVGNREKAMLKSAFICSKFLFLKI